MPEILDCSFGWGLGTPVLGKRRTGGGRRESGMVPFERVLVTSYRPFLATFPLSLRVSEILSLLSSSTPCTFLHVIVGFTLPKN